MANFYFSLRYLLVIVLISARLITRAQTSACPNPLFVHITQVTATSASVDFSVQGSPGAIYTASYYPAGTSPSTALTSTATASPILLTGLTPNSAYQVSFYVNCSASGQTSSALSLIFNTNCLAATAYPYLEDFDFMLAGATPCGYTTLNANNDDRTWTSTTNYPSSAPNNMVYSYHPINAADDWFFTRGLQMQAGQAYQLQFKYHAYSSTMAEALEVKIGAAPTPTGQTSTLFKNTNITNVPYVTTVAGGLAGQVLSYTPTTSGTYYIGFHAISMPNTWYLYVDDILVRLSIATATKSSAAISFSAQASPVPFGQVLNISLDLLRAGPLQLTLQDALGRAVRHSTAVLPVGSSTVAVPEVANLPAGVYFLNLEKGNERQVVRVTHE